MISFRAQRQQGSFQFEVEFVAPDTGVTVLFGPSGAGKSTALAVMAGAVRPDSGRIQVGDETWFDALSGVDLPLEQRRIGWVFQDGRLFPHLRVAQNLDYGRRRRRMSGDSISMDEVIDTLDLQPLLRRWPRDLSGGERQRVAIGRALLAAPRLLLLDEPLASLDAARKREILDLLQRIKHTLRVPMLYVTHSLAETVRLADHLVLLNAGRTVAEGTAASLIGRADTPFLAQRTDAGSLLRGRVTRIEGATSWVEVGAQQLVVGRGAGAVGESVRLYVLATDVILARDPPRSISVRNVLPARIGRVIDSDAGCLIEADIGAEAPLLASVTRWAVQELGLEPGSEVFALIKSVAIDAPAGARLIEPD